MRKIILSILLFSSLSLAQTESQIGWIAKFGAAGGFAPMIIYPNYDGVNPQITKLGMNELSGPMITWGGGGYAYIMLIDNFRLGGYGFSGSKSETSDHASMNNEVEYSLGGGAVTLEYTFPFVKNMALSAGIMLGGGSLDIDIFQNSGESDWNSIWDDVVNNSSVSNKEYSIKNSFYFVSPTINLDYPITRFLAIRGGLGYQFTFGEEWEIANGKKINNVPSKLNGDGFFIQTGLYFGLFAF